MMQATQATRILTALLPRPGFSPLDDMDSAERVSLLERLRLALGRLPEWAKAYLIPDAEDLHKALEAVTWHRVPAWMARSLRGAQLAKGAGHKYVKRVPTGKFTKTGRPRYRYYYAVHHGAGVIGHKDELKQGAAFKLSHDGKDGHFHIVGVDGSKLRIKHDETGHVAVVEKKALQAMLSEHHAEAIGSARKAALERLRVAEKHGSAKQKRRARDQAHKISAISEAVKPHSKAPGKRGAPLSPAMQRTLEAIVSRGAVTIQTRIGGQKINGNHANALVRRGLIKKTVDNVKGTGERIWRYTPTEEGRKIAGGEKAPAEYASKQDREDVKRLLRVLNKESRAPAGLAREREMIGKLKRRRLVELVDGKMRLTDAGRKVLSQDAAPPMTRAEFDKKNPQYFSSISEIKAGDYVYMGRGTLGGPVLQVIDGDAVVAGLGRFPATSLKRHPDSEQKRLFEASQKDAAPAPTPATPPASKKATGAPAGFVKRKDRSGRRRWSHPKGFEVIDQGSRHTPKDERYSVVGPMLMPEGHRDVQPIGDFASLDEALRSAERHMKKDEENTAALGATYKKERAAIRRRMLGKSHGLAWHRVPAWMAKALRGSLLVKGAGHKYVKRVPTGKFTKTGRPRYRYYYAVHHGAGVIGHKDELKQGAAFKLTHNGKDGHFHIIGVDGDKLRIRHDETGHEAVVEKSALQAMLREHHAEVIGQARERARKTHEDAQKFGSAKQKARARKRAEKIGAIKDKPAPAPEKPPAKKASKIKPPKYGKFEGEPVRDGEKEADIFHPTTGERLGSITANYDIGFMNASSRKLVAKIAGYTVVMFTKDGDAVKDLTDKTFDVKDGDWRAARREAKAHAHETLIKLEQSKSDPTPATPPAEDAAPVPATGKHAGTVEKYGDMLANDSSLRPAAMANSLQNFALVFDRKLETLIIDRMGEDGDALAVQFFEDADFRKRTTESLREQVYKRLRAEGSAPKPEPTPATPPAPEKPKKTGVGPLESARKLLSDMAKTPTPQMKMVAVDWGAGKARGQGRRRGRMVMGAMSDAPRGKKFYPDNQATFGLNKEDAEEVGALEGLSFVAYAKARAMGLDHERAMVVVYASEEEQHATLKSVSTPGAQPSTAPTPATPPAPGGLSVAFSADDVSSELATSAHAGTSYRPEKRGQIHKDEYTAHMGALLEQAGKLATPENKASLEAALEREKAGYLKRLNALLAAKSRVVSPLITGRSKFPVKRNQKRLDTEAKRLDEFLKYAQGAGQRIKKEFDPSASRVISSDDADAVTKLKTKIAKLEERQAKMKAANKIARSKKLTTEQKASQLKELLGYGDETINNILNPDWGKPGFETYQLSNNNANIKRLRARVATLEREAARAPSEPVPFDGGEIVEDRDANRVQIHFEDRPDRAMIQKLKSSGFRWSPRNQAWQRQNTDAGRAAAQRVVGLMKGGAFSRMAGVVLW